MILTTSQQQQKRAKDEQELLDRTNAWDKKTSRQEEEDYMDDEPIEVCDDASVNACLVITPVPMSAPESHK